MLITFEGGDGCGKTTQIGLLAASLRERGIPVTVTREPGGTPLGERLRRLLLEPDGAVDPWAEALLFAASRAQLVAQVIRPALADGQVVLCDRFGDSTLAYQGYGLGLDLDLLRSLNRMAAGGLVPDLTILLDLPPAEAGARRGGGPGGDRIAARDAAFHERVRQGYLDLARAEPERVAVFDARRPVEEVAADVLAAAMALLEARRFRGRRG